VVAVQTQVIVVGAGPVGLMLAGELSLCGASTVVIERLANPITESRASQLNARTAEILDERGLLSLMTETQWEQAGHFGGLAMDMSRTDSPRAGNWKLPQYRTEAILAERAGQLGAQLLRAHELHDLSDDGNQVVCDVSGPASSLRLTAEYVVGCDGAASTVRRLGGFDYVGAPATKELLRADVHGISIPDRRFERTAAGLAIAATRNGVTRVMMHEFGSPARDRSAPPDFAEVASTWARVTGEDISGGEPVWVDAFDNGYGHVTRYQRGRVLLAGDAAHWHMPIGGQAINVGLQDAVNLGWKLAAQVRGWAPDGLLSSYHEERHAVGARVLNNVLTQELLLLGGHEVNPLRITFREMLELDNVHDHFAAMVGSLDIRYPTWGSNL
jgi:2-polyprenyl-6-methoxyphenol hydroxylase-like FAD-dependent oxidoreductase